MAPTRRAMAPNAGPPFLGHPHEKALLGAAKQRQYGKTINES